MSNNQAGKGDHPRPCDEKKVAENWPWPEPELKLNVWERDKDGNLK
jgi:hypothetical protein